MELLLVLIAGLIALVIIGIFAGFYHYGELMIKSLNRINKTLRQINGNTDKM